MIGKLLGHTDIETTARYAHLARDALPHAGSSGSYRRKEAEKRQKRRRAPQSGYSRPSTSQRGRRSRPGGAVGRAALDRFKPRNWRLHEEDLEGDPLNLFLPAGILVPDDRSATQDFDDVYFISPRYERKISEPFKLQMAKLRQKISGGFRSERGAYNFARMRAVIATARKQGWNVLQTLVHPDPMQLIPQLRL